ncbi:GNAT family N-acetyltransferase [Cocleimonas sp. KMM 6892]|uniref:GNAT family N-acetyltransferase n=1 Tax=unclassified Cocleimonas TaxID=2639732 RepID=UPI002DB9F9AE|nr:MULTISPECIES: GNAT family N-acetyltransferase [unclassified Cocleimonas]MEB8433430.1 GNAT family N-acetyltransferase [Cocleimonas sp. KMM 6892]MEC4716241.1 GNAT family N-acetyltransferase [Cocleimonas sp. KMM 6895]MEC4745866.1 GNAT family N-acetyltransferase [Cocleimonas sp. KMM 6896]
MSSGLIRSVTTDDAAAICEVYNYYIENTCISFEYDPVSVEEMTRRISATTESYPWIVYEQQGKIIGYAYANKYAVREAYKGTLEVTIYTENGNGEKGLGTKLYQHLFDLIDNTTSAHTLMSIIALPNEASVKLHEKLGFEKAGHFKEVGFKFDQWVDVGHWQKML